MAMLISCNDVTFSELSGSVEKIMHLIQQYRWIIEAYVSDFYTHNYWSKMPACIQKYVDGTEPRDWAWLLEDNELHSSSPSGVRPAPLVLLALKACTHHLSLRRTAVDLDSSQTQADILDCLSVVNPATNSPTFSPQPDEISHSVSVSAFQPPNYKNGQCMDMQHIYRKHVKPKKQHEIQKLGQAINLLSQLTHCQSVIDVGAGLGHLSRLLTFQHGLKVTTLEADDSHAPKASDFDRELKRDVHRKRQKLIETESSVNINNDTSSPASRVTTLSVNLPHSDVDASVSERNQTQHTPQDTNQHESQNFCSEDKLPSHLVCCISHDIESSAFMDIVKQKRIPDGDDGNEDRFILTGLHACGDLSPSLMRLFVDCPSMAALASVACCYMKMEPVAAETGDVAKPVLTSYPMSEVLKKISDHYLNYESREMACHFADAYLQRLKDSPPDLKIHSYRAALQYLVTSVNPEFQSGQVRLVTKKGAHKSFLQYAAKTLNKLNITITDIPVTLVEACEEMTRHWKRVVAFYTIRLSLAPIVESLILLDRILALKEKGVNSVLVPIFDSKMSPRNFVILAVKS